MFVPESVQVRAGSEGVFLDLDDHFLLLADVYHFDRFVLQRPGQRLEAVRNDVALPEDVVQGRHGVLRLHGLFGSCFLFGGSTLSHVYILMREECILTCILST